MTCCENIKCCFIIYRSVNEVICHGIPDMRPLEDGDLLNSMYKKGQYVINFLTCWNF